MFFLEMFFRKNLKQFWTKKNVPFFEKKCFFWKCFFENFFFKISKTFLPTKNFKKNKVLVYRGKKFFFSEKKVFL